MRKVILDLAVSLDGFIEGPKGEYDWCPPPSEGEMDELLSRVDAVFFGRKSFELIGGSSFPDKAQYVFSNTLKQAKGKNVHLVSGDIIKTVHEIKSGEGKDIWLFGGASLTTTFLNEGLIDEMWLGVVPVILGAGKPLFQDIRQRTHFSFTELINRNGYAMLRLKLSSNEKKKRSK